MKKKYESIALALMAIGAIGVLGSSAVAQVPQNEPALLLAAKTVKWTASVGFKCEDGRCYVTADGGVATSYEDAKGKIEASINFMIQLQASKGAKPTGSGFGTINGQKVN
ncbi:hypothetical protein [Humisphaera borealis]|uniref:Uncharacterized protein n=1 Tax=Humisphaera borealis TaxID=2807512 RepID=A0A7M2X2H5_9BACT|nr:hypothetical protein [Humisphaera borealis]QOV90960.1 hypothetical protein IPV69_06255 [Humisphaera borealis]